MPQTYAKHFGIDFINLPDGSPFPRVNAAMLLAKKWRKFRDENGVMPNCDPGDCAVEAIRLMFGGACKMTPWSEIMFRDLATNDRVVFLGPAACGKSFVLGAWALLFYLVDPFNTICMLCTETLKDLSKRVWAPVKTLAAELTANPVFALNLEVRKNEYCVRHATIDSVPASASDRHAILGVALAEGRLQGSHPDPCADGSPGYLFLGVDELSLLDDLEALNTGIMNISTGADFRLAAAANPGPWTSEVSSRFYMPPAGPKSVTPATGSWMSKTGYFIRHFDGERSPCVLDPSKEREWTFLMKRKDIARNLADVGGDRNAARYMKMVRGWPSDATDSAATVLDQAVVGKATEPLENPSFTSRTTLGVAAGVDPAWTPDGDEAVYAAVKVVSQDGRAILDFSGGVRVMPVVSSADTPVLRQLRDRVIGYMRDDGGPRVNALAVDASGNQMLGAEITMWVGPGCLEVNSSTVASDSFVRFGEELKEQKARARIADRGTEAWVILSEFIRAGMVRGIPQEVINDLCNRRFAVRPGGETTPKLRLEPKSEFGKRSGKGSPNKADACALAALAVKERLGVMPFGGIPVPDASAVVPQAYGGGRPSGVMQIGFDSNERDTDGDDFSGVGTYGEPD